MINGRLIHQTLPELLTLAGLAGIAFVALRAC